jgi:hypothetical protein
VKLVLVIPTVERADLEGLLFSALVGGVLGGLFSIFALKRLLALGLYIDPDAIA